MTATVGIDPRIRDRRIAVQRDAGRRRLRRLQALTAVVVGLVIAFGLTRSPVLDVDRLEVQAGGGDVAAIREAAGVVPGQPMTDVDPRQVAEAVAALPAVAGVEVRRSWPGTVAVAVTPREPALAVPAVDGGWLAVGPDGVVVEQHDEVPPGLVGLGGYEVRGAPGDQLPGELRPAAGGTTGQSARLHTWPNAAARDGIRRRTTSSKRTHRRKGRLRRYREGRKRKLETRGFRT